MKVLIITLHYLDTNSGGSFASRAFVNAFAEITDSCLLIYPCNGKDIRQYMHPNCILNPIYDPRSSLKKVIDIYRGKVNRYDTILPQIKAFDPDVVVFDNSRSSSGLIKSIKELGKKVITIHHNYEMEYYRGTKPNILWRLPFMYFMEKTERQAVLLSDLNLTLTEQDLNLLLHHYDNDAADVSVACLGSFESNTTILVKNYKKTANKANKLNFIISGNLSSYQTETSVLYFLSEFYSSLISKIPNSQLTIAGRKPSKMIKEYCLKYPSINLISNPENMQDFIREADVYICPVFLGGGLKIRIMDGLKAGLPILTHEVSARGYDEFKKEGCLFTYNDLNTFMQSLEKILILYGQNKFNREDIQNYYQSFFSFESGVERLKKLIIEIKQ